MKWKGVQRNTAYLLGAGATRGAFKDVLINRKHVRAPLNGDFFTVMDAFTHAREDWSALRARYTRIRKAFHTEFPTRGRWPLSMEEAFSLLYVSKDFPEIYGHGPGRQRPAGTRREIEDFLKLTATLLTGIEETLPGATNYDRLAASLGPNDTLITLNYDTLLDSALARLGWNPATGYDLTGSKKKVHWPTQPTANPHDLRSVKLLKLHGSLNWHVRASYANIQRVFEAKPTRVTPPRINDVKGCIRQIVPPIYGKFFANNHWRRLWYSAHKALLECECIVVIGCSLVDTDFHLTGMLSHAVTLRKKGGNPFRLVALVNGTTARRKWERLLKPASLAFLHYPTFERFGNEHLEQAYEPN